MLRHGLAQVRALLPQGAADLTEATLTGGTISLLSLVRPTSFAPTLLIPGDGDDDEHHARLSDEKKLQLNQRDALPPAMPFCLADIADVMGIYLQNVSANIVKTRIDPSGAVLGLRPRRAR